MAKNKQVKNETKKVEVKPKGPKVDYTPKVPVIKKKEEPAPVTVMYHGESTFTVIEEGAGCSWNEASRQLCLDAAQEMIEGYTETARPALYNFANRAALIENAKELSKAETDYFGGQFTMGSHMKRQRFWKFVSYIANGRIPNDLRLRVGARNPDHFTGEERAKIMITTTDQIKRLASAYINNGMSEESLYRAVCTVNVDAARHWGQNGWELPAWSDPIKFEAAPHDYNPETMKGYKTLKEWSARP